MKYILLFGQTFLIGAVVAVILRFANQRLLGYFESHPHLKFRRQLIQIGGFLVAVLFVILFMPLGNELRGQLISLYGLIISATIALSSTTLVGNMMAGIMLKTIGNCRPGNYITVGDYFGRISEMDLLHTEIQTEERDLTTLPNIYLVTNPVRVMRTSGTILAVEISLGYNVSRHTIENLLIGAANATGLESPFVQIRNLGDHSATYRVSGLLTEVKRLLGKRRELRARTMDALHAGDIEIVSPTFMNTRSYDPEVMIVPEASRESANRSAGSSPDSIVFDKADMAESVEILREKLEISEMRIKTCEKIAADSGNEQSSEAARKEITLLENRVHRLRTIIERKEAQIAGQ